MSDRIPAEAAIVQSLAEAKTVPLYRTPLTLRDLPSGEWDPFEATEYLELKRGEKLDALLADCGLPPTVEGLVALVYALLSTAMAGFRIDPFTQTRRGRSKTSDDEHRRRAAICAEVRQRAPEHGPARATAINQVAQRRGVNAGSLRKWLNQPEYAPSSENI